MSRRCKWPIHFLFATPQPEELIRDIADSYGIFSPALQMLASYSLRFLRSVMDAFVSPDNPQINQRSPGRVHLTMKLSSPFLLDAIQETWDACPDHDHLRSSPSHFSRRPVTCAFLARNSHTGIHLNPNLVGSDASKHRDRAPRLKFTALRAERSAVARCRSFYAHFTHAQLTQERVKMPALPIRQEEKLILYRTRTHVRLLLQGGGMGLRGANYAGSSGRVESDSHHIRKIRLKNRKGTGQKEDTDPSKITFAANIPTKHISSIAGRKRVRDVHVWDQSLSSCQSLIATVSLARSLVEFPNLVLKRGKGGMPHAVKFILGLLSVRFQGREELSLRKSSGT
ncbi:hypothetical protein EDB84DRAFT_1630159 [Lactarius hengduanensis]|nr:hypothetical protein EDB84DRAFT_1630159 [Lactarius hengduanensis]